jgi:hypothetical protein
VLSENSTDASVARESSLDLVFVGLVGGIRNGFDSLHHSNHFAICVILSNQALPACCDTINTISSTSE